MAKKRSVSSNTGERLTPEHILTGHTPEVQELCEALRSLVRAAAPEVSEVAYPSWHGIGYRHPESGYFCAIFPQMDYVKLGFEFGVLLPDPEGLLEGNGKQVRYVNIRQLADIRAEAIQVLIQAALIEVSESLGEAIAWVAGAGAPDGEVRVLGENRTLPLRDGALSDTFEALAVHVYEW